MRLTFLGDLACPRGMAAPRPDVPDAALEFTVVNLEGAVVRAGQEVRADGTIRLYNHEDIPASLGEWNTRVACLANNHILDASRSPRHTIDRCTSAGIAVCGAGDDLEEAARPAVVKHLGRQIVFLAFGWGPVQCPAATADRPGVNPLQPEHVLESVMKARRDYPHGLLVLLMHWDYELEKYPLPMHRQLAFAAVECGADGVFGHHPHCVQGIEVHLGSPIVYSLGNWFLPHGEWFGRPLSYPRYANRQLAFEWRPGADSVCHWFDYDPLAQTVERVGSELLSVSARAAELTPFSGFDHQGYTEWFRRNRHKRRGLPLYADYRSTWTNRIRDQWVAVRHKAIRAAVAMDLR